MASQYQSDARTDAPRRTGGFDPGATVAGLIFIALGVLFMLDSLDVANIRRDLVWPGMLVALGLAVMLSAVWRGRRGD